MISLFILKDICACIIAGGNIKEIILLVFRLCMNEVNELLFLQMFLPSQMNNFPIWYISVLLVIGYLLFVWLKNYKNAVQIMPIICVTIYMLLYKYHGTIDLHVARDVEGLIYRINPGIFRGMADMCLGVMGYYFWEKGEIRGRLVIRILVLSMMAIIIGFFPHTTLDYVFPFLAMVCIINEFAISNSREVSGKLFTYLRRISLSMYFVHVFIIRLNGLQQYICELTKHNKFIAILIELVVIVICSILLEFLTIMLKKMYCYARNKKGQKISLI